METETDERADASEPILVRATIHLNGLKVGQETYVDPRHPYVRECLERRYLVAL